jgi:predicted membrane protein
MNSTKKTARIAGVLYLVNGATGFFGIAYVPSKLIVSGNAAATANNILASERLFRLGIISEVICAVEFIFLLWVLYRLFSGVNKTHASLMAIWGLAFVPLMCVNVLNEIAALTLLGGADFLSVFDQAQREALAMLFLDLHRYGYIV